MAIWASNGQDDGATTKRSRRGSQSSVWGSRRKETGKSAAGSDGGNSRHRREKTTYGRQLMRNRDELIRMSRKIAMYDAEEHWRLGLEEKAWSVEYIGENG